LCSCRVLLVLIVAQAGSANRHVRTETFIEYRLRMLLLMMKERSAMNSTTALSPAAVDPTDRERPHIPQARSCLKTQNAFVNEQGRSVGDCGVVAKSCKAIVGRRR
jgi:hypothetical protein